MAYKSLLSEDRVIFLIGDSTVIELNSYDNVKKFAAASTENLPKLIEEINTNLISFANEELEKMVDGTGSVLQKTIAYVKLLQVVGQYHATEEENRKVEEKQRREASGILEEG
jgi:hypothetical protein